MQTIRVYSATAATREYTRSALGGEPVRVEGLVLRIDHDGGETIVPVAAVDRIEIIGGA